jgi:hypothetical protein
VGDIESERTQALDFALRAAHLTDLMQEPAAELFLELVELCDRKIEIFNLLHESAVALHEIKPPGQT